MTATAHASDANGPNRGSSPDDGVRSRVRRATAGSLVAAGLLALAPACMSEQQMASQLGRALSQPNLPLVVACWESEFEAAGFRGEYQAEVNLTLAPDGSIRDVEVTRLEGVGPGGEKSSAGGTGALGTCLSRALGESNVRDSSWLPQAPVRITGFVFAFTDASAELRAEAKAAGTHVLIGPRADRCMGLYAFHPPREAALLDADIADARGAADRNAEIDPDAHARALQRLYDLALELRKRLELDAANPELSEESRTRTLERRNEAVRLARDVGQSIGCEPPIEF